MALRKEIMLATGVTLSHWVINDFAVNRAEKRFIISVVPYVSKEVRDNGGVPLSSEKKSFTVEDLKYPAPYEHLNSLHYTNYFSPDALEGRDIYVVMYTYLKDNMEFFKGAEDA